jgi:hypothetical protein
MNPVILSQPFANGFSFGCQAEFPQIKLQICSFEAPAPIAPEA